MAKFSDLYNDPAYTFAANAAHAAVESGCFEDALAGHTKGSGEKCGKELTDFLMTVYRRVREEADKYEEGD